MRRLDSQNPGCWRSPRAEEVLRAIRGSDVDAMASEAERRALRREQIERFFLGGLKATKLIQDA